MIWLEGTRTYKKTDNCLSQLESRNRDTIVNVRNRKWHYEGPDAFIREVILYASSLDIILKSIKKM